MGKFVQRKIKGMTCGNCALTVTQYLTKEGASHAIANASTGDVTFEIVDETLENKLFAGLSDLGYDVVDETVSSEEPHNKRLHWFLGISFFCWIPLMAHMFIQWPILHNPWFQLLWVVPVYTIGVLYFGASAWRSIKNKMPTMDVLVFIGATAALVYSIVGWFLHPTNAHEYLFLETTASIITLVLAGNYLEEYTVTSTAGAIRELMALKKTKAKIILRDSIGKETIVETDNDSVALHDWVLVNSGDQIPADGIVIAGDALINESMMTGESIPVHKQVEDTVIGGTIVSDGSIRVQVTAIGQKTVLSTIIQLVHQAQATKPPLQKLADKISAVFVPLVIAFAIITFVVNMLVVHHSFAESMMRAVAVMVIACPCAMGLATPAAVMVGLGRAARLGILIKGGDTLEKCKEIKQFVFDKTGTLTTGKLIIDKYETHIPFEKFKQVVVTAETQSSHPIAKGITRCWQTDSPIPCKQIKEIKGMGIEITDHEHACWKIGNYRMAGMLSHDAQHDIYVLKDDKMVGWIDMQDELRPDAQATIALLHQKGYATVLLSGDRQFKCDKIAQQLGIQKVYAEQLPEQKLMQLKELMQQMPTAMIGDGINDAPALAVADIGISLSDASQIAMQSAQILLLQNKLGILTQAVTLGQITYQTIQQNLFWAFFYNILALPVAAAGYLTPTWGAGIMALSDIILIANSVRLRYRSLQL